MKYITFLLFATTAHAAIQAHPRILPPSVMARVLAKKAANDSNWVSMLATANTWLGKQEPKVTIVSATNSNPATFTIAETGFPFTNPANCVTGQTCMEIEFGGFTGAWAALNNGTSNRGYLMNVTGPQTFEIYNFTSKTGVDSTTFGSFTGQSPTTWMEHGGDHVTTFSSSFFNIDYRFDKVWQQVNTLGMVTWAKEHDGDADAATYLASAKVLYNWLAKCGPAGIYQPIEPGDTPRGSGAGYPARFSLTGLALLHDILWPYLTTTERANGASTLNLWATAVENNGYYVTWYNRTNTTVLAMAGSNFWGGEHQGVTWAAYSMADELPTQSATHVAWSENDWNTNFVPEMTAPDGAMASNFMWESWQYGGGHMARLLMARQTSNYNGGLTLPTAFMQSLTAAIVHDRRPDRALTNQDSVNSALGSVGIMAKIEVAVLADFLAGTTEGGYMQDMLNDWGPSPSWSSLATEVMTNYESVYYLDSTRTAVDYSTLPKNYFYSGRSALVTRTAWKSPTAVWTYHQINDRQAFDHESRAGGNVEMVRGSDRLIGGTHNESGTGGCPNGISACGNTFFFLDDLSFNGINTSNAGANYYGGQQVWGQYVAPIYKLGSNYAFECNDLREAYNPIRTNSTINTQSKRTMLYFIRCYVDLMNGASVYWDRIKMKASTYTNHMRWHFMASPTNPSTNTYKVTVGSSEAFVTTLLPLNATYNLVSNGALPTGTTDVSAPTWHIEVNTPAPSTDKSFMTVLYAGANTDAQPTSSTVTTDANFVGTQVTVGTDTAVIIHPVPVTAGANFTYASTAQTAGSFNTTGYTTGRHYIYGLASGNYTTAVGGVNQATGQVVGTDGFLAFTGPPGSWQVFQDGATPPAPAILTNQTGTLPDGQVGQVYNASMIAGGGTPPYTWSITAGAMCAGLTLGTDGTISGTPTTNQICNFTTRVQDTAGATDTDPFSINVTPAIPTLQDFTNFITPFPTSTAYNIQLIGSGGVTPYSWSIQTGALCAGLTLDSVNSQITGQVNTPTSCTFTLKLTDSRNVSVSTGHTLTFVIAPRLTFGGKIIVHGKYGAQ